MVHHLRPRGVPLVALPPPPRLQPVARLQTRQALGWVCLQQRHHIAHMVCPPAVVPHRVYIAHRVVLHPVEERPPVHGVAVLVLGHTRRVHRTPTSDLPRQVWLHLHHKRLKPPPRCLPCAVRARCQAVRRNVATLVEHNPTIEHTPRQLQVFRHHVPPARQRQPCYVNVCVVSSRGCSEVLCPRHHHVRRPGHTDRVHCEGVSGARVLRVQRPHTASSTAH